MAERDLSGVSKIMPGHFDERRRAVLRAVALTYRREMRAGKSETEASHAAIDEYQRLDPDAPADRLKASYRVAQMICAAINANPKWYWSGPDA